MPCDLEECFRLRDAPVRKQEVGAPGPKRRQIDLFGAKFFSGLPTRSLLDRLPGFQASTGGGPELASEPVGMSKQQHSPVCVQQQKPGDRTNFLHEAPRSIPCPPDDIKLSGERGEFAAVALSDHAMRWFTATGWVQRDGQCWRTRNTGKPLAIPLHIGRSFNGELVRQHLRSARLRDFEMS